MNRSLPKHVLLLAVALQRASFGAADAAQLSETERPLLRVELDAEPHSYVFSRDLTKVAYVWKEGSAHCATVNDKRDDAHEEVLFTSLTFSGDGNHLAYWAKDGGKWRVVRDNVAGPAFDGFRQGQTNAPQRLSRQYSIMIWHATTLAFSSDGSRLAYNASQGGKYFLVMNGRAGIPYDGFGINSPILSPDGQRVACQVWRGKKAVVVVDEKEYGDGESHWQRGVVFSPDSKRWATVIWKNDKPRIILDGNEGPVMEEVDELSFSPDSRHFAYISRGGKNSARVVLDGADGKAYKDVWCLRFSDNGHLAFFAEEDGGQFLVLDGKEQPKHKRAGRREAWLFGASYPALSSDGAHAAYVASEGQGESAVIDSHVGATYEDVWEPLWSKDGQHVAYVAFLKKTAPGIAKTTSTEEQEKEAFVVRDSVRSAAYASAKAISFSPNGRHLIFVATRGENQCVIVDGKEGKTFDLIPHGGEPQWLDDTRYRYLGLRGESLCLVEGTVEP